jgi:hypothetical protein
MAAPWPFDRLRTNGTSCTLPATQLGWKLVQYIYIEIDIYNGRLWTWSRRLGTMHHWKVGGPIDIGWPDQGIPPKTYTIVEFDRLGQVFRGRVTDGSRQGGFLVIYSCPDVVLEQLAEQATNAVGFKVIVSSLRCSIDGTLLRSFDYEWYPTPEYAHRPSLLARTLADLLEVIQRGEM